MTPSSLSKNAMGKSRSSNTAWMPKYVKLHKGRYVYVPYLGRIDGKVKFGKEVVLGKEGDPKSKIFAAYEKLTQAQVDEMTVRWLLDAFMASDDYKGLTRNTRDGYEKFYKALIYKETKTGVFGQVSLENVTPPVIRTYLDQRKKEDAGISGNKEIGFLSSAWSWMYQRREGMPVNPCKGVKRNAAPPRQHYVEDKDYYAALNMKGPWYIPVVMEIAYLCRMRKIEVLDLRLSDVTDKGLKTRRTKGSKSAITKWSPRLKQAIMNTLNRDKIVKPINPDDHFLISDKYCKPIDSSTFDSAWQRRMRKFEGVRFTLHDLKRKGVSDSTGDKLKASGHYDPNMLKVYDVRPDEVEGTK